jgi:prepilin-type N-terminal cleavage/methylation domain-containing protein
VPLIKTKAFSLIELLVVLVLIGIISVVAVPNIRSFLSEREMRNDLILITDSINKMRTDMNGGLYKMSQISLNNNNGSGLIVSRRYRDANLYNMNITCSDNASEWITDSQRLPTFQSDPNIDNLYSTFSNIRINSSKTLLCFSVEGAISASNSEVEFCHKETNTAINCNATGKAEGPYFKLNVNRFGKLILDKWSQNEQKWITQVQ